MADRSNNTILQTFEFEIRTNAKFVDACERTLDGCRNLYNCALEQRISLYAQTGKGVGFIEQCRQLTDVRAELPEVAAVYRDIQTDVLKRLDKAFDAFFRRLKSGDAPGFPRFKGRDLALSGLVKIFRAGFWYRRAGVTLNGLEFADRLTKRLWEDDCYERHRRLMAAIDRLNGKFGRDTVRCGMFQSQGVWRTRFSQRSPRYTTCWDEIMRAV